MNNVSAKNVGVLRQFRSVRSGVAIIVSYTCMVGEGEELNESQILRMDQYTCGCTTC